MTKKRWITIVIVVILAIFIIPVPSGMYQDGGTREYTALTYKIVAWNRLVGIDGSYHKTRVYFFPDNFKSIGSLLHYEEDKVSNELVESELKNP